MRNALKQNRGLLFFFTGVSVLVLAVSSCLFTKYIMNEKAKNVLTQSCKDYLSFLETTQPVEFINYSEEERNKYAQKYLEQKKSEYNKLFSHDVAPKVKAYENCESLVQKAVNAESIITYSDYQIVEIGKLDVDFNKASVDFLAKRTYIEVTLSNSESAEQPVDDSEKTYYHLTFIKENNVWKISNVNLEPFYDPYT